MEQKRSRAARRRDRWLARLVRISGAGARGARPGPRTQSLAIAPDRGR